jgi:hypothetical protein
MLSPISSTLLRSTSRRCCSPASTASSHYCRLQLSMRSRPRSGARRTRRSSRSSPASSRRSRRRRSASRMLCSVRLTTRNTLVMFDDHTVSGWKSSCCVFDRIVFVVDSNVDRYAVRLANSTSTTTSLTTTSGASFAMLLPRLTARVTRIETINSS